MEVIQRHHVHKVLEIVTLIYPEMINIWSQCQVPVGFLKRWKKTVVVCLCAHVWRPGAGGGLREAFDIYQTTENWDRTALIKTFLISPKINH